MNIRSRFCDIIVKVVMAKGYNSPWMEIFAVPCLVVLVAADL